MTRRSLPFVIAFASATLALCSCRTVRVCAPQSVTDAKYELLGRPAEPLPLKVEVTVGAPPFSEDPDQLKQLVRDHVVETVQRTGLYTVVDDPDATGVSTLKVDSGWTVGLGIAVRKNFLPPKSKLRPPIFGQKVQQPIVTVELVDPNGVSVKREGAPIVTTPSTETLDQLEASQPTISEARLSAVENAVLELLIEKQRSRPIETVTAGS